MQDIEPYFRWRDQYISSEDSRSPFYKVRYSEMYYTHQIYNYYIHPQWDDMDSETLYLKILYVDYVERYAIIEFIGEWNDAIQNDIMYLKRKVIEKLTGQNIIYFVLIMDNVLNFHSSDDCYYEEWYEEISDEGGWITMLGVSEHVEDEMASAGLQYYINFDEDFNDIEWRKMEPGGLIHVVNKTIHNQMKRLRN
ncbi:MAG: hypothetical protein ABI844_04795 [Saprospiraceae bacterium]